MSITTILFVGIMSLLALTFLVAVLGVGRERPDRNKSDSGYGGDGGSSATFGSSSSDCGDGGGGGGCD